jgi:hypothetical protein
MDGEMMTTRLVAGIILTVASMVAMAWFTSTFSGDFWGDLGMIAASLVSVAAFIAAFIGLIVTVGALLTGNWGWAW